MSLPNEDHIPIERLTTGTVIQPVRNIEPKCGRGHHTPFRACIVPDCGQDARSRAKGAFGFCHAHYRRWKRHGDPLGGKQPAEKLRYLETVVVPFRGADCLIWPFGTGYSTINVEKQQIGVHREVCRRVYGEPPTPEHEAAHSCGNGICGCVNPMHLRWATHAENIADTIIHGTSLRGTKQPTAKLTENAVREIRQLASKVTQTDLGRRFGVTRGAIRAVISGRNWGWLK